MKPETSSNLDTIKDKSINKTEITNTIKQNDHFKVIYRDAKIEDVSVIVEINIRTWQSAYKGIFPDVFLEALPERKQDRIQATIADFGTRMVEGRIERKVVAEVDGTVVGYASYGACREVEVYGLSNVGEIYALYIYDDYQGYGIGKGLVSYAAEKLNRLEGDVSLLIWALERNPYRGFYEKLGGDARFTKQFTLLDVKYEEVGYFYERIERLYD